MRKILLIGLSILTSIVFTACGGGGGGSSFKQAIVDITVTCVAVPAANDFDTYVTLYPGDTVVNDQPGTNVSTYHNINGETKVCLNSGAAHVVRN